MSSDKQIWAILPLKSLHLAKQRLSGVLSQAERRILSLTMLNDVLIAIKNAKNLDGLAVVTCDDYIARQVEWPGVRIIKTGTDIGMAEAVTLAAQILANEGIEDIITLPGDVPLVTGEEIDALCRSLETARGITVVPDRRHRGTNSIACTRRSSVPFAFGAESFATHVKLANERQLPTHILDLAGLSLDVDVAPDIEELMAREMVSGTQQYLQDSGIADRIAAQSKPSCRESRQMAVAGALR